MTDESLVDELIAVLRELRQLTNPVRRGEITAQQYWLLRLLHRDGPMRVSLLAAQLGIGQSAATTACQRLARQGLLTRTRATDDERVVLLALTEAGRKRVEDWLYARRAILSQVLEPLTPSEQQELAASLHRLREAVEGQRHQALDAESRRRP